METGSLLTASTARFLGIGNNVLDAQKASGGQCSMLEFSGSERIPPPHPSSTPGVSGPPQQPPKNWAWIAGGLVLTYANNISIQKWGASWPNWTVILLYAVAAVCLLVAATRFERALKNAGVGVWKHFWTYPLSSAIVMVVAIGSLAYTIDVLHHRAGTVVSPAGSTTTSHLTSPPQVASQQTSTPAISNPTPVIVPEAKKPPTAGHMVRHSYSERPSTTSPQSGVPPTTGNAPIATIPSQPETQSVGSVDCTANSGNCAGINNGTQVTNKYDSPPVTVTMSHDIKQPDASSDGHPRVAVKFYTDRAWDSGWFAVICNRPCHGFSGTGGYVMPGSWPGTTWGNIKESDRVVAIGFHRQFPAATWGGVAVESNDGQAVEIVAIKTLTWTSGEKPSD
jgi:hypothetical protein